MSQHPELKLWLNGRTVIRRMSLSGGCDGKVERWLLSDHSSVIMKQVSQAAQSAGDCWVGRNVCGFVSCWLRYSGDSAGIRAGPWLAVLLEDFGNGAPATDWYEHLGRGFLVMSCIAVFHWKDLYRLASQVIGVLNVVKQRWRWGLYGVSAGQHLVR